MSKPFLFFLALFCISGCLSPSLDNLDFVETTVLPPAFENFNAAKLKGQLMHQGYNIAGECGFLWAYSRDSVEDLSLQPHRIILDLSTLGSDGNFEFVLDGLKRGRVLYVRSFANIRDAAAGERKVISDKTETFEVGEVVINTGQALIINDSAIVFGQLQGIKALGKEVQARGHIVSTDSSNLSFDCSDCLKAGPPGSSNNDDVFQSSFGRLEFNTTYYYRSYAIAYGDTFYSRTINSFRVRDGWERISNFPYGYASGTAAVIGDNAYAGFGCQALMGCTYDDLLTDFWKFDPTAQNGLGQWTASVALSPFVLKQYNATSFAVGDKYYALFGEYFESGVPNSFVLSTLNQLDLITGNWTPIFIDSIFTKGRTGAVAFTLQGRVYMGTGRDDQFHELNDFWQYDPVTTRWRQVASLPQQINPISQISNSLGRYEAVAFTIGNYGYVGSGLFGSLGLRDFWRFRPPVNDQDPGEWTLAAFLPPEAPGRYQAVGMSIGSKGYVGTGYDPQQGYLRDWWQFDPDSQVFHPRSPLPGLARTNAMGFSINGRGYLGTGQTKFQLDGGLSTTEYPLADFWRYIPEE